MPRAKANAASTPVVPVKLEPEEQVKLEPKEQVKIEPKEQVKLEPDEQVKLEPEEQVELEDPEEMEEDVEYEEVEEEIEEEEEVEEEEEDEDAATVENEADGETGTDGEGKEGSAKDGNKSKKHAELLSLPPHGSEIYVGSLTNDTTEEDLKAFFGSVGEVTEVRLMKARDKDNKGYAFVAFKSKDLASKAIDELNNAEFKGKRIKVSTSQAKNKLFIGNVPRTWSEDDVKKVVAMAGPGVTLVEVVKDTQDSNRNRGYAFVEYYNHACAEYAKKKMSGSKFKLDSKKPTVSWADSKSADTTVQVKAIYVKNLPKDVTHDQLHELFEHHGEITKVVLPPAKSGHEKARYGFVHFAERSMAMNAIKETEKYELDGQVIECSLAKPPSEKKPESASNSQKPILPSYPPRYGLMGAGYGLMGAGNYAVPFGQAMMYGGRGAPPGVAMVPMLMPDGRVAYVLQQPGVPSTPPQQRSGGSRSGGSGGSKHGNEGNRGRRYRPY